VSPSSDLWMGHHLFSTQPRPAQWQRRGRRRPRPVVGVGPARGVLRRPCRLLWMVGLAARTVRSPRRPRVGEGFGEMDDLLGGATIP
jgi:hypothetical protein